MVPAKNYLHVISSWIANALQKTYGFVWKQDTPENFGVYLRHSLIVVSG